MKHPPDVGTVPDKGTVQEGKDKSAHPHRSATGSSSC